MKERTLAYECMRRGQFVEAIGLYDIAIAKQPTEPALLTNRAAAYMKTGDYQLAIQDCQTATTLCSQFPKAWWRLGQCYEARREWGRAFQSYVRIWRHGDAQKRLRTIRALVMGPSLTSLETCLTTPATFCVMDDNVRVRGVVSNVNLHQGDLVMAIRYPDLITVSAGRNTTWGRAIQKVDQHVPEAFVVYLVFALVQKLVQNPNDPYMLSLPTSTEHLPMFWSEQTLDLLGPSHIRSQILQRRQNAIQMYELVQTHAPGFTENIHQSQWLHLVALVSSRNFTIRTQGRVERVMVPFADMLNHHSTPNTKWFYDEQTSTFQVRATQDVDVGDVLYDSYGDRDNGLLLSVYGFSQYKNPRDRVRIANGIYLHRNGLTTFNDLAPLRKAGVPPRDMELAILRRIGHGIMRLQYPTTRENDQAWMATHKEQTPEYFIRQALLSEKRILYEWAKITNECLRNPTPQQRKQWKKGKHERLYLKAIYDKFKL
jgi:tetratricopeptide (TPR) repeat protein|tara:strand:+ start:5681 stop:7138 length:1458 start_codon:yes stop_codon:yes gene_type:complete